jgi:hypothetical protein
MQGFITDKTVGNTAVGVLAQTVHYTLPYRFTSGCYVVGSAEPRIHTTLRAENYSTWKETRSLTFLASDRIDGNGDVTSETIFSPPYETSETNKYSTTI